jgi:hypothetical protein
MQTTEGQVPVYISSSRSRSRSHITTDGQSASSSWCLAPLGAGDQMLSYIATDGLSASSSWCRARVGPHRKRLFRHCVSSRCRGNDLSTEKIHSNGCCIAAWLHRRSLAMGPQHNIHKLSTYTTFGAQEKPSR